MFSEPTAHGFLSPIGTPSYCPPSTGGSTPRVSRCPKTRQDTLQQPRSEPQALSSAPQHALTATAQARAPGAQQIPPALVWCVDRCAARALGARDALPASPPDHVFVSVLWIACRCCGSALWPTTRRENPARNGDDAEADPAVSDLRSQRQCPENVSLNDHQTPCLLASRGAPRPGNLLPGCIRATKLVL